jgi:hypothetical protein
MKETSEENYKDELLEEREVTLRMRTDSVVTLYSVKAHERVEV